MNDDDRTEQALRRALDDAARQVVVPTAGLPEPSLTSRKPPPRRPLVIAACLAAVAALVAGSILVFAAAHDEGASSIQVGTAAEGAPITAADADVDVYIDDDTLDVDFDAVRSFLESNPDVTAYTYVTTDQALAERQVLNRCASGVVGYLGGPVFRLRVGDAAAREPLAEQLASMRAVARVQINPTPPPGSVTTALSPTTDVPTTAPSSTTLPTSTTLPATTTSEATTTRSGDATTSVVVVQAPTTTVLASTPAATEPPSSTTPVTTDASSKEIPFVLPALPDCAPVQSTPSSTIVSRPSTAPAATLPPAGDQPADPDAARRAVNDLFVLTHTGTAAPVEQRLEGNVEDYEELLPLIQQAYAAHERDVTNQTVKIYDIRFVSPTRAAVQFQNFIGGPDIVQVQYAVLIDGQWKIARESECDALARAGVHCPEGP